MSCQVRRLYKDLMRYGQTLKFTDKIYFRFKVRKDFYENRDLSEPEKIKFFIEVIFYLSNLLIGI